MAILILILKLYKVDKNGPSLKRGNRKAVNEKSAEIYIFFLNRF